MSNNIKQGRAELRKARGESRGLYWFAAVFSFFANLLMLTGPLYMLQVYDRVLSSRSEATLVALSVLVVFLYSVMGILDYSRGRVMARVGARFQTRLDARVFSAVLRKSAVSPASKPSTGLRDLESIQRFMTSPVLIALFDLPWTPIFLFGIWLFHPVLGMVAIAGGLVLILVTYINQLMTRTSQAKATMATVKSEILAEQVRGEAELVKSLGMHGASFERWQIARGDSLKEGISTADVGGSFTTLTKALRLILQSAMLGIGAYYVLQGQMTPGAMIAGSILLGRALAPIESAMGQWPMVQRAIEGWDNLAELLGDVPPEQEKTPLPKPRAILEAERMTIVPPGEKQPALSGVTFKLSPGQACGVIGPSGAGKSTLARALTGVWRPVNGSVRLDGAALDNYEADVLGSHIGYLPQRVQLFEGTIAENIARMSLNPNPDAIHKAAKMAGAYDMILELPEGFDTQIQVNGGRLSGGQVQRIGLARAMYGDPVILILDEPNSNLDNEGNVALNNAIKRFKAEGKAILIMAHRPAAIQECDLLLMIENGGLKAFGPKDKVLQEVVQNHNAIKKTPPNKGGVS